MTSRDEKQGLEAVETLKKELEISDQSIVFHQLDVSDPVSVTSLAEFVKTHFGKLDILVLLVSSVTSHKSKSLCVMLSDLLIVLTDQ